MRSRHTLLTLLALCIAPVLLRAQDSPEAVVESYGAALRASDWPGAARLMHPAALTQIRGLLQLLTDADTSGDVLAQFFGIGSAAEFAAMPDTVLYARFLKSVLNREGLQEAFQNSTLAPLGHVSRPGDTVFVVSRMTVDVEGTQISSFQVMPMLRWQGTWRQLLQTDFSNLVTMLRRQLGTIKED
jgi:hypothetical protein